METWIIIPLSLCLAPVLIVALVLLYRHRQTQARYRTILQLAEQGAALPAGLLEPVRWPADERRRGLLLVGGGLGLMAMLAALPLELEPGHRIGELWGLGLPPLMIGLAYLLSWWFQRRDSAHD